MNLLFVYGTLKRGYGRNQFLSQQRYLGTACTKPKYAIYQYAGYPAMIEMSITPAISSNSTWSSVNGFNIYGEIYEATYECLEQLDSIENTKEQLFKRSEINLDQIVLAYLPISKKCWESIEAKKSIGYIFCKDLSGAKCCGNFWTSY